MRTCPKYTWSSSWVCCSVAVDCFREASSDVGGSMTHLGVWDLRAAFCFRHTPVDALCAAKMRAVLCCAGHTQLHRALGAAASELSDTAADKAAQQQQHDQAQESIDALVSELQDTMDRMQELTAERADTHKQVGAHGSL